MTTTDVTLAIRWDHLTRIMDSYPHWNPGVDPDFIKQQMVDKGHRYLLVESSTFTGDLEFSTHGSPASAFHYSANQECADDWNPERLIDLDTLFAMKLVRSFGVEVESVHKVLLLET